MEEKSGFTESDMVSIGILCLVVSSFDILGNVLIIVVYVRSKALHVATRCLIIAVSVADINMGVVDLFHVYPYLYQSWIYGRHWCGVVLSMGFGGLAFTMWCLMCVSVERYVAVLHPMRYVTWMPPARAYHMLALCALLVLAGWSTVLAFTQRDAHLLVLPHCAMWSPNYPIPATVFMNVTCVVTATVIIFTNVRVLITARKQAKQIMAWEKAQNNSTNTGSGGLDAPNFARKVTVSDRKAAFMLITLSLVFTLAMVPGLVFIAVAEQQNEQVSRAVRLGQVISAITMGLNGAANIFIYFAFNSKFRQGLKDLLLPCVKSPTVNPELQ